MKHSYLLNPDINCWCSSVTTTDGVHTTVTLTPTEEIPTNPTVSLSVKVSSFIYYIMLFSNLLLSPLENLCYFNSILFMVFSYKFPSVHN